MDKQPKVSRRDFMKLVGAAAGGLLVGCSPLKNLAPVVKELPQSPETNNMRGMMDEVSQLFPEYKPELTYLKAGKLGDDGRRQIDRHYVIFSSKKTSEELDQNPKNDSLLFDTLKEACSFSAAQVRITPGGQSFVPPVTTEAIRRIREDHMKNQDLQPPNYTDATDFVGVAVRTTDNNVYLFESHQFGVGVPNLVPYQDIVDEKSNLTDKGVVTIDGSMRMEPLTGRPFPTQ